MKCLLSENKTIVEVSINLFLITCSYNLPKLDVEPTVSLLKLLIL